MDNQDGQDFFVEIRFLACQLNITEEKIYQLNKKGLPVKDRKYPFFQCVRWYIKYLTEQVDNVEDARARANLRLIQVKAENVELENLRLKNKMLDAEQIRQQIIMLIQLFKDSLLGLPGSLCHDLENKDAKDIRDRLDVELKIALNKVAERIDNEICKANNIGSCGDCVENENL